MADDDLQIGEVGKDTRIDQPQNRDRFFVDEVQWYVSFDLGCFAYAQEVSVPYHWLGRVTLQVFQQNLFFFAINNQID